MALGPGQSCRRSSPVYYEPAAGGPSPRPRGNIRRVGLEEDFRPLPVDEGTTRSLRLDAVETIDLIVKQSAEGSFPRPKNPTRVSVYTVVCYHLRVVTEIRLPPWG